MADKSKENLDKVKNMKKRPTSIMPVKSKS